MPYYKQPGWHHSDVIHRFENTVTNCAENFIDLPHTVFVHPGIFRQPYQQKIEMTVTRSNGTVVAEYRNETTNLGWWSRFLNPHEEKIYHSDRFFMPNVTSVEYKFGLNRRLFITSQSVPETETSTRNAIAAGKDPRQLPEKLMSPFGFNLMLSLILFWLFFCLTIFQAKQRQFLFAKPPQDWLLDSLGLGVQGGLIPLLQIGLGLKVYQWLWPQAQGCLNLAPWIGLLISFVGVDYLYYWNHRLLHRKLLFPIHALHHTVTQMDMMGSARNTLWSSLFLPYIWVNSIMV